jgi:hypothetical protein
MARRSVRSTSGWEKRRIDHRRCAPLIARAMSVLTDQVVVLDTDGDRLRVAETCARRMTSCARVVAAQRSRSCRRTEAVPAPPDAGRSADRVDAPASTRLWPVNPARRSAADSSGVRRRRRRSHSPGHPATRQGRRSRSTVAVSTRNLEVVMADWASARNPLSLCLVLFRGCPFSTIPQRRSVDRRVMWNVPPTPLICWPFGPIACSLRAGSRSQTHCSKRVSLWEVSSTSLLQVRARSTPIDHRSVDHRRSMCVEGRAEMGAPQLPIVDECAGTTVSNASVPVQTLQRMVAPRWHWGIRRAPVRLTEKKFS